MDEEILTVLNEIRGILFLILGGFGILVFLTITRTVASIYLGIKKQLEFDFTDKVGRLFKKKKYKDIVTLCNQEIEIYPRSAEAFWWLARAYYYLGNDIESLKLFKEVIKLEPEWEEEHITPYIEKINERIKNR